MTRQFEADGDADGRAMRGRAMARTPAAGWISTVFRRLAVPLGLMVLLAGCAAELHEPSEADGVGADHDTGGPNGSDPDASAPREDDGTRVDDDAGPTPPPAAPARSRIPLEAPVRAAWVHLFDDTLKSRAGIDSMIAEIDAAGVDVLFAQVIRRHDAYYASEVLPRSADPALSDGFDVLDELLAATADTDIAVHAWYSIAPTDHGVYDGLTMPGTWLATRHGQQAPTEDRWVTRDADGTWSDYLDVGLPQVRDHVVGVVTELAERYPIAGIHLDYARYPSARHGYHPQVLARFRRESSTDGVPSADDPAFTTWRRQQPTALVAAVREALRTLDPDLALSAAVITWGDGPGGPMTPTFASTRPATEALQDWPSWLEQDLVDLVAPMNYFRAHEPDQAVWFDRWLAYEARLAAEHDALIVPGIGAWLNRPDAVVDQTERAVKATDGAAIYSVQQPTDDDERTIWARLRAEAWPEAD